MRVLHVVPSVAARYGGPSEASLSIVAALRVAGVDALLATTDADGRGRLPVSTGIEVDHRGTPCIFFRCLPGESLKPSIGLGRWLERNAARFDVLHVHSVFSHASIAAGRAARSADVPYVLRPLGQLDAWSLAQHPLRKKLFLASAGRVLVEQAAALHWTAASEAERSPGFSRTRPSFVVPLGVDEVFFAAARDEARTTTVLFLSRIHPKKNVETLIEAFRRASEKRPEWRLLVAGDGEAAYVRALERQARETGARIEFAGWLSDEGKRRVLGEAALLALPSRHENFGLAVAEALAAGTPVVISETVALSEDVRSAGAGWVVAPEPDALAGALAEAMSSEIERKRRGEAGRRLAQTRFRWTAAAKRMVEEYQVLLASRETA